MRGHGDGTGYKTLRFTRRNPKYISFPGDFVEVSTSSRTRKDPGPGGWTRPSQRHVRLTGPGTQRTSERQFRGGRGLRGPRWTLPFPERFRRGSGPLRGLPSKLSGHIPGPPPVGPLFPQSQVPGSQLFPERKRTLRSTPISTSQAPVCKASSFSGSGLSTKVLGGPSDLWDPSNRGPELEVEPNMVPTKDPWVTGRIRPGPVPGEWPSRTTTSYYPRTTTAKNRSRQASKRKRRSSWLISSWPSKRGYLGFPSGLRLSYPFGSLCRCLQPLYPRGRRVQGQD